MSTVENHLAAFLHAANNNQFDEALSLAEDINSADLADALEQLEPYRAKRILERLANRAAVFGYFDADTQSYFSQEMSRSSFAKMMTEMPSDERVDLFKQLDQSQRDALLPALAQAERENIRKLASYVEGTAGAIMTSDYVTLRKDMNMVEALDALRAEAPDAETIYHAYVIDKDRKLIGVVSLRALIVANPGMLVNDLMVTEPIYSEVSEHQEDVAKKIARYDLLALPIIDENGAMVGIVTHDDAMDVVSEEATEDFLLTGAVAGTLGNLKDASIALLYRSRIFWLVFLVFGNLFSGAGIAYYEDIIESHLVLVFFLPLLVGSGGNAGSQSSTLMVRALATGEIVAKDWLLLLGREALLSLLLGITMALAVAAIGYYRGGPDVAWVLIFSMIAIVMIGCLIGMSLPFVLNRLGLDPASASAPLVTSICDIAGVIVYLFIASQFLELA